MVWEMIVPWVGQGGKKTVAPWVEQRSLNMKSGVEKLNMKSGAEELDMKSGAEKFEHET